MSSLNQRIKRLIRSRQLKRKRENDTIQSQAVGEILKYFDRIHDKLFNVNNIILGGYFALIALPTNVGSFNILLPFANCCFLIFIDYKLMEKSRMEAKATSMGEGEIKQHSDIVTKVNLLSLASIVTTLIVALIFLVLIFSYESK